MKIFYKNLELLKVQICTRSSVKKWMSLNKSSICLKNWSVETISQCQKNLYSKVIFWSWRIIKYNTIISVCLFHLGKQKLFKNPKALGKIKGGPETAPCPTPFLPQIKIQGLDVLVQWVTVPWSTNDQIFFLNWNSTTLSLLEKFNILEFGVV